MNCTECKEILVELVEGLLSESQSQIVKEHLNDCGQCRSELEELKALGERLTCDSEKRQQISEISGSAMTETSLNLDEIFEAYVIGNRGKLSMEKM